MSHEVESMAYAGAAPWHKLGTKVDHLMTSEEAIKAAGLDWTVSMQPVYVQKISNGLPDGVTLADDWKAVQRDTDSKVFAVVGAGYVPVQNTEAFHFFDEVVSQKQAYYETAGSLRGGSRVWMLANLPDSISVKGEEIRKYLTLVNSHDGTLALQMFWTPVRVVCMNTLTMALSSATNSFYARHTTYIHSRVYKAQEILGLANKFYDDWILKAQAMALKQLPAPKMPLLLAESFSGLVNAETIFPSTPIMQKNFQRVEELVYAGRGQSNPAIQGTVWQAYNAVTEFVDYEKEYKDKADSTRLYNSWFGTGADIKKRAWNWCMKEIS